MKIRYYSHASFQIISASGKRLLLDPWLYNPIYANAIWQFPECSIPLNEYINQDFIYISHEHPDHFCLKTLSHFARNIPIIIRKYGQNNPIKPLLIKSGYSHIIELEHGQTFILGKDFSATLFCNRSTTDSALVISDERATVFHQNDCMLSEQDAKWIGNNFDIDLGLLFFSSASMYPTFFDIPEELKQKETVRRNQSVFERTARYASFLKVSRIVPCAGDCVYFRWPETDKFAGCLPIEFKEFATRKADNFDVLTPNPGDVIDLDVVSQEFVPSVSSRQEWIEKLNKLRQREDVKNIIAQIQEWENQFYFQPEHFLNLFDSYCKYVKECFGSIFPDPDLKKGREIKVVIQAKQDSKCWQYEIELDFPNSSCKIESKTFTEEQIVNLPLVFDVAARHLGAVIEGGLTFDDLKAGYLRIKRQGGYTKQEAALWYFLSVFSNSFLPSYLGIDGYEKSFKKKIASNVQERQ
ncbi:MAG: MBL fold metallo-hydrolase [Okeania sp. SIO3I5]|uniref:MBL fold metallo-hydrolase n=1 Tax=Okeania sp. SIO3I5 TaxID=2607805 RepID=UPI0013BC18FE|nr:MBL fold metallo-hydrolase [Okeania sp. SIO3I5]NEQ36717.1 MBL fold metallo-hydrolase [Okeania sp. SIO3I5]